MALFHLLACLEAIQQRHDAAQVVAAPLPTAKPQAQPAPVHYINEPLAGYVDQAVFDAALERNAELAGLPYGWDLIEGDDESRGAKRTIAGSAADAALVRAYQQQKGRAYR